MRSPPAPVPTPPVLVPPPLPPPCCVALCPQPPAMHTMLSIALTRDATIRHQCYVPIANPPKGEPLPPSCQIVSERAPRTPIRNSASLQKHIAAMARCGGVGATREGRDEARSSWRHRVFCDSVDDFPDVWRDSRERPSACAGGAAPLGRADVARPHASDCESENHLR